VIAVASVAVVVTSRRWPGPSRRYQAVRFEDPEDSRNESAETDDEAGADAATSAAAGPAGDAGGNAALDRDSAIDSWDELSRGEDPTR
jgi:hypothetical protein